jgi:DNA-directed RNA polymerase beta' subunit
MTFATQKFFDYLHGSGIKTTMQNGVLTASPLQDKDILAMSNGKIRDAQFLNAKNLEPERGGFYDPVVTGGLRGNKWSHYDLAEPMANPVMERPIKSILGLSTKEYEGICQGAIGVRKSTQGGFDLHDVSSGGLLRNIQVNSLKSRPIDEEPDEEADDEALQNHL